MSRIEKIKKTSSYRIIRRYVKLKRERELIHCKFMRLKAGPSRKTILFIPTLPNHPWFVIYKICHYLAFRMTNDLSAPHDLAIHWQTATHREVYEMEGLNKDCNDISKIYVDKIHKKVFGYGLNVNPETYIGKVVSKSDINAKHDGFIVECPIKPVEQRVFQIIVNNEHSGLVQDIRAPIINNSIPFLYIKYRPIEKRFLNQNKKAHLAQVDEYISLEESQKILEFTKEMGLDYGELDLLRDKDSGKLYIVDVNNTPTGPPNGLSRKEAKLALVKLASEFEMIL